MKEELFWFEEVPEDQRYWFVTQWGLSPAREEELEAERQRQDDELPPGLSTTELTEMERAITSASVFGGTPEEAREKHRKMRELLERMDAAEFRPEPVSAQDVMWTTLTRWEYSEYPEYVIAPMLFTTREAAEQELNDRAKSEADGYLDLVQNYGAADVDEALDNTSPLKLGWVDNDTLLSSLEDADFLCVMVNGTLRMRRDLIAQLSSDEEEQNGE